MGSLSGAVAVAVAAAVFAALVAGGSCMPAGPNITTNYDGVWLPAKATWYGKPNGAGPSNSGGACGINRVNLPPYNSMSSCGNLPIFKDGKGCGSCYQIKCVKPSAYCSRKPVMVTITDVNYQNLAPYRFDLSGTAFGAMAVAGKENALRHTGIVDLQFRRVPCKYPAGTKIVFHVEKGSNPNYLAVLVKFVAGDGNIVQMDLMDKNSPEWMPMRESWGAIWRMDTGRPLKGPFCIRLTSESGKQRIAYDVIPANYVPGSFYTSKIQF